MFKKGLMKGTYIFVAQCAGFGDKYMRQFNTKEELLKVIAYYNNHKKRFAWYRIYKFEADIPLCNGKASKADMFVALGRIK